MWKCHKIREGNTHEEKCLRNYLEENGRIINENGQIKEECNNSSLGKK